VLINKFRAGFEGKVAAQINSWVTIGMDVGGTLWYALAIEGCHAAACNNTKLGLAVSAW
jgi:hypothetical protein